MKTILALFIILGLVTSCSMEKRVYGKGYYVDWKSETKTPSTCEHISSKKINLFTQISKQRYYYQEITNTKKAQLNKLGGTNAVIQQENHHAIQNILTAEKDSTHIKVRKKSNSSKESRNDRNYLNETFAIALLILAGALFLFGFWFYCLIPFFGAIFLAIAFFAKEKSISHPADNNDGSYNQGPGTLSILALILAIISLLLTTIFLGGFIFAPILALLAIIFSYIEVRHIRRYNERKKGMALLIISLIIGALIFSLWFPLIFLFI